MLFRSPFIGDCRLKTALTRARDAFLAVLDSTTLADVTANGGDLLEVLDLTEPGRLDRRECPVIASL